MGWWDLKVTPRNNLKFLSSTVMILLPKMLLLERIINEPKKAVPPAPLSSKEIGKDDKATQLTTQHWHQHWPGFQTRSSVPRGARWWMCMLTCSVPKASHSISSFVEPIMDHNKGVGLGKHQLGKNKTSRPFLLKFTVGWNPGLQVEGTR